MGTLQERQSYLELVSHSEAETRRIGFELGQLVQASDLILLIGELGTGKTCLVQGLAQGMEISGSIPSPSFVLAREYRGRLSLYHLDFYRLEEEEVAELGLEDYLSAGGVCIVEWAERGLGLFPPEYLLLELRHLGPEKRWIKLSPYGERYRSLLSKFRGRWS